MNEYLSVKELELLIPDYLNGHASIEQVNAIESAMHQNDQFRITVESERMLLDTVRNTAAKTQINPDFSALERRIDKRQRGPGSIFNARWGSGVGPLAASAAFALVLMISMGSWFSVNVAYDDFETLSSEQASYEHPTLRIIGSDTLNKEEFAALLNDYNLEVVQSFPAMRVYDVIPLQGRAEDLVSALGADERFRSVRIITEAK